MTDPTPDPLAEALDGHFREATADPWCRHRKVSGDRGTDYYGEWRCDRCGTEFAPGTANPDRGPTMVGMGARVRELEAALVEAALPLEVIVAQDAAKPYAEMSRDFLVTIRDAVRGIRAALNPEASDDR